MVNKSIQRAKVKVISIATGLGFSLYETGDLQFEDDGKPNNDEKKKIVVKEKVPTKTVIQPTKGEPIPVISTPATSSTTKVVGTVTTHGSTLDIYDKNVVGIADLIYDNKEDILPILQTLNKDIIKVYGFSLSPEDDKVELLAKINNLSNPAIFNNMLIKRLADNKKREDTK